ncbi:MAG: hypothetical protein J0H19_11590 [Rhodospirillales bacterium]|nr:hypothetical protein [Rhodospirillales bacterium]MBN8927252.1 hypothetical protein [Rhodospirillales bacterium]
MSAFQFAPRRRLGREIGAVLLFKLLALALLWVFCFGPAQRPAIDPDALFAPAPRTVPSPSAPLPPASFPPATR